MKAPTIFGGFMKNKFFCTLIVASILPFCANATDLKQFNVSCTFKNNTIKGKNTTGGPITKAAEDAVHEFSFDLIKKDFCTPDLCPMVEEFIGVNSDIITTSLTGSHGIDEDGDWWGLVEEFNLKTDTLTFTFTYLDKNGNKEVGSSIINYQCEVMPFDRGE